GKFLPKDEKPVPRKSRAQDDYSPFEDRVQFETADFLYTRNQMSAGHINYLCLLWAASLAKHQDSPPFGGHRPLYETIDSIPLGDVAWTSLTLTHKDQASLAPGSPHWKAADYDVWYRDPHLVIQNILANPDFDGEFDYTPVHDHLPTKDGGSLRREDFISGDWAWK
ncbi:hypothetical protein CERSUDRAFT_34671, partial [Gelatoporia subvermispora B]